MLRFLLLALLTAACGPCADPPTPSMGPGLVAVVEAPSGLEVRHRPDGGNWSTVATLPAEARALRFSPDRRHVAWTEDVTRDGTTRMQAWRLRAGQRSPELVGELGLRKVEAPGLAIANDGRVAWVDSEGVLLLDRERLGRGHSPLFVDGGLAWIDGETQCLTGRGLELPKMCGAALRLLEAEGRQLVVADQRSVTRIEGPNVTSIPIEEAVTAALSKNGRLAIVRRTHEGGTSNDELLVLESATPRSLAVRAILLSIEWDTDGSLLVVQKPARKDLYELMLAHAPEEFGGERVAGTAVRIAPETGEETRVEGLPETRVRMVVRAAP